MGNNNNLEMVKLLFQCTAKEEEKLRPRAVAALDALLSAYQYSIRNPIRMNDSNKDDTEITTTTTASVEQNTTTTTHRQETSPQPQPEANPWRMIQPSESSSSTTTTTDKMEVDNNTKPATTTTTTPS